MYLPSFFSVLFFLFSLSFSSATCVLDWFSVIVYIKKLVSCKYNPSRRLNVRCMKSKNIQLRFIVSSFWTSMSYLSRLRAILYCSNNSSLLSIIIHGLPISNGFIFLRWRSYTFFLLNFRKPVWILNMFKIKYNSLPSAYRIRIVFWQLQHTKQWVVVSVSIYTLNPIVAD